MSYMDVPSTKTMIYLNGFILVWSEILEKNRFTLNEKGDVDGSVAMVDPSRHFKRNSAERHSTRRKQTIEVTT